MKKIDLIVSHLCEQIDELENDVQYWKDLYTKERDANNKMLDDNLKNAKKGVANALMFALSVKDDDSGNLVISRENRKTLSERLEQ